MKLPRLHVVTDDAVLARPAFAEQVRALLDALGGDVALHLRALHLDARRLHDLAAELAAEALRAGALFLVNERVDIALAVRSGAHVNLRSIPVVEARRLLHNAWLGYSAHTREDADVAAAEGADFVALGTIYATASHPDREPAGEVLVRKVAPTLGIPVVAIGGVTLERVPAVLAAGAYGAAVIRGVWDAENPVEAARAYVAVMKEKE